ncbi:WD40 repeat-like protein [Ascodesmis nigricans]|uniref:WD40 repeat-like protein n=1 Tax=Ascodesmis nigricans TaxID=341454 RepID=A0A4S2N715_9PEZI|nr:WD40 repeat-like protein [Ascodesmis nigricans]
MTLRVTKQNDVSVYTISGSDTAPSLPDWLARKRKRALKNDEAYMNRIELIQDFEFEEASQCIQVSEDGEYAMATGTYKPQIHVYHLPSSSLKFARHTSALNLKFLLLSQDYSKSLHLQTDRSLEFHTPMGCHYATRIPRYGRDIAYLKAQAHAVVAAEGSEVYRLDLEAGRFLKPFELGGFDGVGGTVKAAECIGVADGSHSLLAFGTNAGTTEFWDPRSRNRVGILGPPPNPGFVIDTLGESQTPAITSAQFHSNGLTFATGNAAGIVTLYDLRSPTPILRKDQGYGFPIHTLKFLSTAATEDQKLLSADKKVIKLFDSNTGKHWVSIQPSVDINYVCPVPKSGMILTANEGQQMHSFLIPALGPSPWWCSHLDSQIEQLADRHINDPDAYNTSVAEATTYDNFKFLTKPEMRQLGLDNLLTSGKGTGVVRPYMHGYFVDQRLYDEARLIADPFEWDRQRQKLVKEKIDKERESRIRSTARDKAAAKVKVNKRLLERLEFQEQKLSKKRPSTIDEEGGEEAEGGETEERETATKKPTSIISDPRFAGLFEKEEFAVDENSLEFKLINPSTRPTTAGTSSEPIRKRGKTAVEEEEEDSDRHRRGDSDSDAESASDDESDRAPSPPRRKSEPEMRISSSTYRKSGHDTRGYGPAPSAKKRKEKSFAARASTLGETSRRPQQSRRGNVVGEKEVTFYTAPKPKRNAHGGAGESEARDMGSRGRNFKDRRSASGNTFRRSGLGK